MKRLLALFGLLLGCAAYAAPPIELDAIQNTKRIGWANGSGWTTSSGAIVGISRIADGSAAYVFGATANHTSGAWLTLTDDTLGTPTTIWSIDYSGTLTTGVIPGARVSGAVATSTALAANGGNCSAGSFARGVDASGAAENCTSMSSVVVGDSSLTTTVDLGTGAVTLGLTHLAYIEALTPAADRLPYYTGATSAALATFTAAGRALVDDADASAQRTTLGVVIGTNVQAYDADLTTWAGVTPGTGVTTALAVNAGGTGAVAIQDSAIRDSIGDVRILPQNSKSAAYTTVLSDSGKSIFHPSSDTTARTWTIDSNANVAYSVGTMITFVNATSAGVLTIAITSDTMYLAGAGTTGSRTMTGVCIATAYKATSTTWIISGGSCLT